MRKVSKLYEDNSGVEVIIVEADPKYQRLYKQCIKLPASITFCNTLSEALILARVVRPDLVILDLHQSIEVGLSAIKRISKMYSTNPAKIIAVTSSRRQDVCELAAQAGANDVWVRRLTSTRIKKVISALV